MNNNDNFSNEILEHFESYLVNKTESEEAKNTILEKGEKIIDHMLSFSHSDEKDKRKFLMVGKVQSGKTINFISTIVNAYKKGINLIMIFTSYDSFLYNQTVNSVKEAINGGDDLSNFISMFEWENIKNETLFYKRILSDIEKGKLNIIISMKDKISKINDIFIKNQSLCEREMLIIDDEGDLGSYTHNNKNNSKTYDALKKLIKNTNSYFLSVTATPQVHLLTDSNKYLKPNFVHTINPGKGYNGLEYFEKNKDKYFHLINEDTLNEWWQTEDFKDSVLYYLITAANLLNEGIFQKKTHSNMLIHTDVKNSEHEKYKTKVDQLIQNFKDSINSEQDEVEYINLIQNIERIIKLNSLNIKIDNNFIESLRWIIKMTEVEVANQNNNKIEKNQHAACIVIGSALVARGVTFDNLLVTFFTIRAKQIGAVDTILQRARWFGYRSGILDYIKIYTTKQISDDFTFIYNYDKDIWKLLTQAEENNLEFDRITNQIVLLSERLKPTSKAPNVKPKIFNKFYSNRIDKMESFDLSFLITELKKSQDVFTASSNNESVYKYKSINLNSITDLYKYFKRDDFAEVVNIDKAILPIIESESLNHNIKVVLLDSKEKDNYFDGINYRVRSADFDRESQKFTITNLFQGKNPSSDLSKNYVGDNYWNDIPGEENTIFIQVHCVKPINNDHDINFGNLTSLVLVLPKSLEKKIKNYSKYC